MIILGIAGSLRKGSYNISLLKAAKKLAPKGIEIKIFDKLGDITSFDQDNEKNPPPAVTKLKEMIRGADAVLLATPEYNYSVPGVLKNAIDWASRPYGDNAWEGKPVAIMSASTGIFGAARAQYHLRQSFVFLNMFPLSRPEVMVPEANKKFDDQCNLTDEYTKKKVSDLLEALVDWTKRLKQ